MQVARSDDSGFSGELWSGWGEDGGGANWLLSYADMLSVVLALMVALLGHLAAQRMASAPPESPAVRAAESAVPAPAAVVQAVALPLPVPQRMVPPAAGAAPLPAEVAPATGSHEPLARLTALVERRLAGLVQPVRREHGVSLVIADAILFESGKAELREDAQPLLTQLAMVLLEAGDARVAVEGHTDSRPVHGGRYASNWELAAARATAVTRFLISRGFPPHRLRSVSYADTRPVADEVGPDGYARNRRVNLLVEFPPLK